MIEFVYLPVAGRKSHMSCGREILVLPLTRDIEKLASPVVSDNFAQVGIV